jgi:hypothetical protein
MCVPSKNKVAGLAVSKAGSCRGGAGGWIETLAV